jgi:hypothetical protein
MKTFLDKVTVSDIAYTILVYENTKEVWEENLQIKVAPGLTRRGLTQCM